MPSRVQVAVFLTRFEPGGTERQMTELIRRLDPDRFAVHVACFQRAGAWLPRIAERAASIVEFPIRGFARPGSLAQLMAFARWCRRARISVVQTCDLYANILGLPGAALARVPVRIGSRRELNPDKTPGQIWLQRQAYRSATKVVANSTAAREMLEQEGLATGSIAVIPNGVDLAACPERSGADRRTAPDGRTRIITVANLRPEKDHEVLIEAIARIAARVPNVELQIVGDGPRRARLESLARRRGLGDRVVFVGHREDVPWLLAKADLFVLPSRSEAFPNAAVEAMACGLPVIASRVGGLLDLVDDGRTGVLVEAGRVEAFADALVELLTNPAKAAALGAAARAHVHSKYSFDRMVSAFETLYLSGLEANAVAREGRAQTAGI